MSVELSLGDPSPYMDGTFGALFIGLIVATALWGVTVIQVWYYFDNYRNDSMPLRLLVLLTFITDTTHQALITHAVYYYCIRHWGSAYHLTLVTTTLYVEVLFNGLTAFAVQTFFVARIWKFRQNFWIIIPIIALVLANLALAIAYFAFGEHSVPTLVLLKSNLKTLSLTTNALAAITAVAISLAVVGYLDTSKTGFAWSDQLVNRLMIFTINTGLITSLCAVGSLIFYVTLPSTFIYFALYLSIGRLYCNSLLTSLNARHSFRKRNCNTPDDDSPMGLRYEAPDWDRYFISHPQITDPNRD